MEKLIIALVVLGFYAVQAWLKKKAEKEQAEEPPPWPGQGTPSGSPQPQRSARAPAPTPAARWEEELRRLLEGDSPKPPPPPVIQPVPPPLPPVRSRKAAPPKPVVIDDPDMQKGLPIQMPTLEHSAQAFLRASQLESKVAEHMRRVEEQVTGHKKIESRRGVSPDIRQAIGLVRSRQSQRAAIIAGIVLGPPKALEG